ncbi:hypothetical protein CEP13_06865 [Cylindrospermopsis raciborskii C03]|uniref:Cadherin domain-containing protein n=1 Tax=Cylindrospermopsis raciborskii C07 TaxID=2014886 RepID=A0ABX4WN28_9CYAN|nr:Calx-beta domain-containing protein [Cylindrospermopsis raciborskii]PNJ95905.1 hypothetical protein CEP13_06865 [Cylindrospermopsis raciborskii C03]PNJ99798.1 hypothetical protein CEP15_06040 [Cylindrospermopsis raciborskii C07]
MDAKMISNIAFNIITDSLQTFSLSDKFWRSIDSSFGTSYNRTIAELLRGKWEKGDFSDLPPIQIVDSAVLSGGKGAYSRKENTIYLSSNLVCNVEAINKVIIEEIGHYVDAQINQVDSPGDEGAIFAALVQGNVLSANVLAELRNEDDKGWLEVNGQKLEVEYNHTTVSLSLTSPTTVTEDGSQNLFYVFSRTGDITNSLTVNFDLPLWNYDYESDMSIRNATINDDYVQRGATSFDTTTGSVTFAAGSSMVILSLDPSSDVVSDGNKTVELVVGYRSDSVTGTILDNDVVPGTVVKGNIAKSEYFRTRHEYRNSGAFAALKSDGSVVTWGDSSYGGDSSSVSGTLTSGVTQIFSNDSAFAALKSDGSVVTWGFSDWGGNSSSVRGTLTSGVTQIFSTKYAFAALKSDGSVVTWGLREYGGDSSSVSSRLTSGVTQIFSNELAFAALKSDGSVVTWGDSRYGGNSSSVSSRLTSDVTQIFSTSSAFAALKSDGSVVTWGDSSYGGDSSIVSSRLMWTSGVTQIFSNERAFAALKSDGSVVTWGDSSYGGDSSIVRVRSGVTQIFSTSSAFAALKSDGSVVTWGDSRYGGNSSSVSSKLTSGVTQIFSNERAFAALKSDGSVVTWGDSSYGGNSSSVSSRLTSGVTQIFSTSSAFAALKSDGSVVTWNSSSVSSVSSRLTSGVTQIFSTSSAFAALKSDGSVVTWGGYGGDSSSVSSQLTSGVVSFADPFNDDRLVPSSTSFIYLAVSPTSVIKDGTSNLIYTFSRTGSTTDTLLVNYTIGGTATNGSDYDTIGTSVTFVAGSSTATVIVNPTADTTPEDHETTVSLTLASGTGYNIGTTTAVTGIILDKDTIVTLAVSPASVTEDGTTNLIYTFTRNGFTSNARTVNYTIGGTAINGNDYSGIGSSVTFAAGSSTATVIVNPTADTTPEDHETVSLTLASGTGYNIGTSGAVTGTITNDDLPTINLIYLPTDDGFFFSRDTRVAEDGTSNLFYTFTRTGPTTNTLTVNYTIGGTATNGIDYGTIGESVTFAAGSSTATVIVNPTADTTPEDHETVSLTLASGTGYNIGTTTDYHVTTATRTILDDDTIVTLAVSPASVTEDGTTNLIYTFTRNGFTSNARTVNYTIGGTAINGNDYNYSGIGPSVTFAAGSSTATVIVNPTADTTPEKDETVSLTLATLDSGTGGTRGTTTAVIGTILDDDTIVTLTVSPTSVTEDGTSNLIYTFTRNGSTTNTLLVNYTISKDTIIVKDGLKFTTVPATNGIDYGTIGESVTFAAGSSTATVTVDPTADTTPEDHETVSLTLASGTGYNIGTTTAVIGTILDDDTIVTLAVSPTSVTEDGTSNLIYTFTRTGFIWNYGSNSLTVNYTIEGTATNGSDYTNIGTSVTFVAGSSTATVTVDPTSDTTVENDETVILTLASGTGYTIGTSSGVTGTITNSGFSFTGVISQSYIAGATIFFDTNFNYKWDEGEVKTISDEYGAFVLELPDSIDTNRNRIIDITEGQLIARDGFDTSSGLLFGALTALPNSTILTPLTSVQAKLVQDGLTVEEANNLLTQQLGLDSTLVLENFDPLEAVGQQKQVGLDTYLIHIQVQALSLLDGFQIVTKSKNLLNTIYGFAQFLKHRSLKTTIPFDFTSEAEIRAFLDFLLQAQNLKTTAEKLDAIAQIVAAGNQLLLEVSKVGGSKSTTEALPALASVKRVVQGSSIELIQQLIKGQKSPQQSLIAAQEFLNQNFTFVDSDLNAFGNRTIQIKALARRIDETNGQSEFEIQLSQQAPNQGLKILYSLSGTATLGADYQIDSKTMGELYIAPGETSAKISISTIDDQIAEPVETITINLKSVGEGYLIDPTSPVALIRIQDNETAIIDQVIKGITLEGTIGDDSFIAADGNDKLEGSYGNDFFDAKGGDDIVNGGYGDDILLGGEGDDWITGGHGNDNLEGNAGNDQIDGGSGNDYLQGGEGADILNGGMGNDTIEGNGGNDQIDGGDGNDILLGNEDNDWLTGQVGNDILIGGTGDDILNGGEGADVFYFSSKSEGFDTILDFNPEQGDKIQVSKSGFAVNNLDGFRFISGVLDFQGQNLALIQNDGRTYSYFPNLSDIIQLVETPTVTVSTEAKAIETQLIVSANLTEQTALTKFATIPVNSGEPTVTTSANPDNLLAEIQQRGYIRFSGGRSDSISGVFDYQFVRAIAAAIFGDANRVDQVPGTFSESFSQVANKQVDLSTRHITQNLVRDGELNVDFGPVYYYDFLSVLVRNKSGIQGAKDLNGKKIGVVKNTTALTNLDNLLDSIGVQFTAEVFDTQNDLYAAYNLGEVDAIASDKGIIYDALEREILENKQEHRFLDIQFSKEPIGLVIPENESEWGDVVRWVVYTTIQAEEYGINSQNIDRLLADNTDDNSKNDSDPAIRRFLGLEGLEGSLGSALELPQDFVVQVIKQVGNYGEIYQRSFPSLTRDLNLLSLTGGLLESLPFSGRSFDQELVNNDQRNLLAEIQNRGFIKYGLPQITGSGFPGFAEIDSQGQYKGFDVDLSKAIAAAVFGDPSKVEYTQQAFANSFANTANGLVDVSAAGYTGNLMRDAGLGVDYSPVYIHTGQGILTRKDSGITGIATLNGSTIGALTTVTAIENLSDLTKKFGSTIIITPFDDKNKMYAAYEKGEIDAVYNDKTLLAGIIPTLSDPQAHEILPETFSKEPLTLILDENQSDWADVVRWVMNSLVQAEEYGITSTNIDDIIAKNRDNDPNNNSIKEIQAFLGLQGNPGASLGLSSDFVVKMIKAVGNYGEIYARNFDTNILPREKNDLYHFSGLQYALPLGSLNQPPSFTGPDIFSIDENTRLVGIISTKDPEQDAITFALGGVDYSLFAINPSTGELTFNTAPNFEIRLDQDKNHLYQLQVIANDTKNNQVSQNISIRVTDVNESPIAEDDRLTLTEVTTQMIDPLQNDRDPDLNDQLKIISKTDGQYGRVDIRDNQLVYTLLDAYQSYAGNDIFTYTISDAKGLNATGSVNVMVKEKTLKPNSVVSNPFITINSSSPLIPTEAGTQSGIVDQISFRVPVNYNPAQIKEVLQNNVSQTSAAFNNIFGLYEIDDSTGRVNNILPGQLGYTEAALSKVVTNFAVRAGGSGNTVNGDVIVNGGKTYAPFVIANGGNYSGSIQQAINEFFQVNPNNSAATAQNYTSFPVAYFSFGVANPDGAAHIKNFGNNVFGFEDLPAGVGVSDYDFNDMLFSFG